MLTTGILLSLLFPLGFVAIFGIAAFQLVKVHRICRAYPQLKHPYSAYPGQTKTEIKHLATKHLKLARVLEFALAHTGLWIYAGTSLILLLLRFGIVQWF